MTGAALVWRTLVQSYPEIEAPLERLRCVGLDALHDWFMLGPTLARRRRFAVEHLADVCDAEARAILFMAVIGFGGQDIAQRLDERGMAAPSPIGDPADGRLVAEALATELRT